MFENNTDRMFWTIAVLILGATLSIIGNRAFPKAQESIMTTISQNITTSKNSSDHVKLSAQDGADIPPKSPQYNQNYEMSFHRNRDSITATIDKYVTSTEYDHVIIPRWTYDDKSKQNVPVTEIGEGAFFYKNIESVQFNNHIVKIGNWAFQRNHLKTLELPTSLEEIGPQAFYNNWDLQNFKLNPASNIKKIGGNAFYNTNLSTEMKQYLSKHYSSKTFENGNATDYFSYK